MQVRQWEYEDMKHLRAIYSEISDWHVPRDSPFHHITRCSSRWWPHFRRPDSRSQRCRDSSRDPPSPPSFGLNHLRGLCQPRIRLTPAHHGQNVIITAPDIGRLHAACDVHRNPDRVMHDSSSTWHGPPWMPVCCKWELSRTLDIGLLRSGPPESVSRVWLGPESRANLWGIRVCSAEVQKASVEATKRLFPIDRCPKSLIPLPSACAVHPVSWRPLASLGRTHRAVWTSDDDCGVKRPITMTALSAPMVGDNSGKSRVKDQT